MEGEGKGFGHQRGHWSRRPEPAYRNSPSEEVRGHWAPTVQCKNMYICMCVYVCLFMIVLKSIRLHTWSKDICIVYIISYEMLLPLSPGTRHTPSNMYIYIYIYAFICAGPRPYM